MADKNTVFQQKLSLNVRGRLIDLSRPRIMGILNLTPDSFYDGGVSNDRLRALKKTEEHHQEIFSQILLEKISPIFFHSII